LKSQKKARPQKKLAVAQSTKVESISFKDIGGLQFNIRYLKESIVYPMLYPEVFKKLHFTPTRRILFHGPSGTGKTLLANALANECNQSQRKVTFFMRKGSDYLSQQLRESERNLRLVFEAAEKK